MVPVPAHSIEKFGDTWLERESPVSNGPMRLLERTGNNLLLKSQDGNNHTQWRNQEYDSLLAQASPPLNREEQEKFYPEAEKIIKIECPIATSLHHQYYIASNDRIDDPGQSDLPVIPAQLIKVKPDKSNNDTLAETAKQTRT